MRLNNERSKHNKTIQNDLLMYCSISNNMKQSNCESAELERKDLKNIFHNKLLEKPDKGKRDLFYSSKKFFFYNSGKNTESLRFLKIISKSKKSKETVCQLWLKINLFQLENQTLKC